MSTVLLTYFFLITLLWDEFASKTFYFLLVTTSGVEGACSGSRHTRKMNLLHTVNLEVLLNGRLDCRVKPVQLWRKEHFVEQLKSHKITSIYSTMDSFRGKGRREIKALGLINPCTVLAGSTYIYWSAFNTWTSTIACVEHNHHHFMS